jgi:hypothetical protein
MACPAHARPIHVVYVKADAASAFILGMLPLAKVVMGECDRYVLNGECSMLNQRASLHSSFNIEHSVTGYMVKAILLTLAFLLANNGLSVSIQVHA